MDTASLKSFATWARTSLLREVTARMAAVLAPGASERVEQPKAIAALEKAVTAAGGGDKGRAAVADKVAYTWFNRIIALRFMDANGYTGIGVVSPQAGVDVGQPEILSEAKRGVVDNDVVGQVTRSAVAALLDSTRASGDPQGEAYALLLAAYCRYWNTTMPFMFERAGDFTELLIPANLLAEDSVLNRSVKVLTEGVCKDVEVIGWLYQFYISERKSDVFAGFKKNKKAGTGEIPAATQLFTPHWIVRYLVENSLGRLWMLNRPASGLIKQMDYYIAPVDEETDFLQIAGPEDLTVIDPACGSGHMLTYAFDLLYAIYEEEGYAPSEIPGLILKNNLYGIEIDPRAGALAAFALTMKARARQRTFFTKQIEPNVCVLDPITFSPYELDFLVTEDGDKNAEEAFWNQFAEADTLGSLIRPNADLTERLSRHLSALDDEGDMLKADVLDWAGRVVRQAEFLASQYSVVVANPPYMGGKNLPPILSEFAKLMYPRTKSDLYSMFIERNLALGLCGGFIGMITMQSWMFLSTFSQLRAKVLDEFSVVTMAHLGAGSFDTIGGEVVATTAFVIRIQPSAVAGVYLGLADLSGEMAQSEAALAIASGSDNALRYEVASADFGELPLASMAYWLSPSERHIYRDHPSLQTLAETKQGLATGDNNRFLRYWWEVSNSRINRSASDSLDAARSRSKWFPIQKGGTARRWTGNDEYVVDWYDDGKDIRAFGTEDGGRPKSRAQNTSFYFKEGATWSSLSSEFAMRFSPSGFMFETKGSMLFPRRDEDLRWLLGYLNTPIARKLIDSLSPTLDYHEGPVARIPVIRPNDPNFVITCVKKAHENSTAIWSHLEISPCFVGHWIRSGEAPLPLSKILEGERIKQLSLEDEILEAEREIEEHFRASGKIEANVFPLESQRPTGLINDDLRDPQRAARLLAEDLISYAVGCMFGRYSLDYPGLMLADQGVTLQDYLARVPSPVFSPDADNVIPIVDGDWFEDDIVERFRQFLRVSFGEHRFEENLRFVTESLGVKNLRYYFVRSFYKDHVQRYKKRPIYWMFSSPKGSFNALIYMHRYTPSTVSTVLNEYLREFQAKLKASLEHAERSNNTKEADRLRKVLLELDQYEHDVLYPLASRNIAIDLDDGVAANYPKFGTALNKLGPR
ncbi:BREX-1 system adenine-specific DNA-methyltransferase PglX [Rhodococcus aetherivorans]